MSPSSSSSPPARRRSRRQARDGEYDQVSAAQPSDALHSSMGEAGPSSRQDSNSSRGSSAPPATQQQTSTDRLPRVTEGSASASASPSRSPERRASSKVRSTTTLYPPRARVAKWPHFAPDQGRSEAKDGYRASLEANLYGEVKRIAQQLLQERRSETKRQAAAAATASSHHPALHQDGELLLPAQSIASSAASSSSSSSSSTSSPSSPPPDSPISSRSASSLEFSEDEDLPAQGSSSQDSDTDSQDSLSSTAINRGREGEDDLLHDTLLDPLVIGVQARLDALLHALAVEHSARQKRAGSKKGRKRLIGHREVLGLIERSIESESLGTVELQQKYSVLNKTRKRVARALDLEPAEEPRDGGAVEFNTATASASALPVQSAHDSLSQAASQGRESAARRDAVLLLEPLGLLRPAGKRKREWKKRKPSAERLAAHTTEPVETQPPKNTGLQRRQQPIRGRGGFLLCRPPISSA